MKLTTEQQNIIGGVRVEGNTVIIKVNGGAKHGNNNARQLCSDLVEALNAEPIVSETEHPSAG